MIKVAATKPGEAHDFDSGPGVSICSNVEFATPAASETSLHWDQPFFSISGPFDAIGRRLQKPEVRQQPAVVAPDGASTVSFGRFFGTSAAGVRQLNDRLGEVSLTERRVEQMVGAWSDIMDELHHGLPLVWSPRTISFLQD
jgi:hypothetical protein